MSEIDPLMAVLAHRLLNHAAAVRGLLSTVQVVLADCELPDQAVNLLDLARIRCDTFIDDLELTMRGLVPPGVLVEGESN